MPSKALRHRRASSSSLQCTLRRILVYGWVPQSPTSGRIPRLTDAHSFFNTLHYFAISQLCQHISANHANTLPQKP
jgi:hypothetical protein